MKMCSKNSSCSPVVKILRFSLESQKQSPEVFCKKAILKKANFTGKLLCQLQPCNLFEKRLQYTCCPVKFAKFKNIYFEELLLESLGQNPVISLKMNSAFGTFPEIFLQIQQFFILRFPEYLVSGIPCNEWVILVLLKTESLYYNPHNYRNRK